MSDENNDSDSMDLGPHAKHILNSKTLESIKTAQEVLITEQSKTQTAIENFKNSFDTRKANLVKDFNRVKGILQTRLDNMGEVQSRITKFLNNYPTNGKMTDEEWEAIQNLIDSIEKPIDGSM